uniref:Uncharacterized protein n=1 Tax=Tanacetum cinerariifolium TaxID=118510 RepID=A0A699HZ83_TANCI|nr:hypothetical protein [Tanacetum cinerariifolium]
MPLHSVIPFTYKEVVLKDEMTLIQMIKIQFLNIWTTWLITLDSCALILNDLVKIIWGREIQQSRISILKIANKNVVSSKVTSQSSGSYILLEVEMELQEALHDLVRRKMLTFIDVAYAESYLSTSTRESSIFQQQEDLGKRCAMIINAGNNAEEKIRKMGGGKY